MKRFISTLLNNTRNRRKHGFTLIELLIVIAILGILIVVVLVTLNPIEAQRKTRDAKRLRDLASLQTIMEQWIAAGNTVPGGGTYTRSSSDNGGSKDCDTSGWLGLDVCLYTKTLPSDPLNKPDVNVAGAPGDPNGCTSSTIESADAYYQFAINTDTNQYEINAVQESTQNCDKNNGDSGNSSLTVEVGTSPSLVLLGDPPSGGESPTTTPTPTTPLPTFTPTPTSPAPTDTPTPTIPGPTDTPTPTPTTAACSGSGQACGTGCCPGLICNKGTCQ